MSNEILDALTQLFALSTMQDGGTSVAEQQFVKNYFLKVLDQDSVPSYIGKYYDYSAEFAGTDASKLLTQEEQDRAFMKFSVKVLKQCKEINKILSQDQKVVVLVKILELLASDSRTTPRRMEVVETAAATLELKSIYELVRDFVLKKPSELLTYDDVLIISSQYVPSIEGLKHIQVESLDGEVVFLRVKEVDMYFVKYTGRENTKLNDFIMKQDEIYQFSSGSILRTLKGNSFYYSDITTIFVSGSQKVRISFNAIDIEYKFKNGALGLRGVSIAEGSSKLIGIMGASGAGKTTLLNVLAGIETPSKGQVLLNGIDIHADANRVQGVIGYVAQDDLLVEELTVYQNLYYSTKLCFKNLSENELDAKVIKVLGDLGLEHIKDLKVGNVLNKTISGGQRKRLNIALELIREPTVMFLDEPTSGLSSRDSENVLDLLKELSSKGKLIFVVIHQPSSDIFKMFDKLIILDTGGYQAFYGNPVDGVIYFKEQTNQVKATEGQCFNCGNVNPEQIFDIIEDRVVTEKGEYTDRRKITPIQWKERFRQNFEINPVETETEPPPKALDLPGRFRQIITFTIREFLAKIGNKQYVIINLLEAPLLAFLLAFIIRFQNDPITQGYTYRYNDNIPAYILICVLVALFMGLTVSAEEIIKDRKIQKREAFLNLSRHSYLTSKLVILFTLSAIQTISFVLIGNAILEIKGMNMMYWMVLFTVSCFSNLLGLNISATFNSVVAVYITIPLLLIPQMILSGVIFNFNNLNRFVSDRGQVPLIADLMVSRWGFEAIAVEQFKSNKYKKPYYELEKEESIAGYRRSYWLDEMKNMLVKLNNTYNFKGDSARKVMQKNLDLLKAEIRREKDVDLKTEYGKRYRPQLTEYKNLSQLLNIKKYTPQIGAETEAYLDSLTLYYNDRGNIATKKKNAKIEALESKFKGYNFNKFKDKYHNESLDDLAKNANVRDKILEYKGKYLQQIDPAFHDPLEPQHMLDYRTHFLAPSKHFVGQLISTYWFNIIVMWLMSIVLYFTLYFESLKKIDKLNIFKLFNLKKLGKK